MKPNIIFYFAVGMMSLFLFVPLAIAQSDQPEGSTNRFLQHNDQNNDGKVTLEEFTASHQEQFSNMDRNGDGQISKDDREETDRRPGMMGRRMLRHCDGNKDGVISSEEYDAAIKERFEQLDKDQNGVIDENELPQPPPRPRMEMRHAAMLKHLDTDGNGKISKDEYDAANEKRFSRLDQNGDGEIDESELPVRRFRRFHRFEGNPDASL